MLSTKSFFSSLIRFITSFTEHLPVESQVVNVTVSNGEELHGLMQDTQHHKKSSADQRLVPHFCWNDPTADAAITNQKLPSFG